MRKAFGAGRNFCCILTSQNVHRCKREHRVEIISVGFGHICTRVSTVACRISPELPDSVNPHVPLQGRDVRHLHRNLTVCFQCFGILYVLLEMSQQKLWSRREGCLSPATREDKIIQRASLDKARPAMTLDGLRVVVAGWVLMGHGVPGIYSSACVIDPCSCCLTWLSSGISRHAPTWSFVPPWAQDSADKISV